MKLREIRVEGFGALRDRTHALEGPVTVLYGPNEAGKSTLLHMIRAVLFGFPPRGQAAERFEPEAGGPHGGALVLELPDGVRARVARRSGDGTGGKGRTPSGGIVTVSLPDGTGGGEELLRELLGGVTGEQFKHLFAFTLTELQELRTLTSGELGGFLHSAGLGVRASAVTEAERRLVQEMEARFKPRGKNQGIGRLLADSERQEAEWRKSLAAAGRYNDMAEELERLSGSIAGAEKELELLRARLVFQHAADQLRERWLRRETIRDELGRLPDREGFPVDGLRRQEELLQELERRTASVVRLKAEEDGLRERVRGFTEADAGILAKRDVLNGLLERLGVYKNGFVSEAEWTAEADGVDARLRGKLAETGLGPEAGRLAEFSVTLRHQAEAQRWKDRSAEQESRLRLLLTERDNLVRSLREAEERASDRLSELQAHRERMERQYPGRAAEWAPLLPALIRELRRDLQEAESLKLELRHLEERELEYRLRLEQLRAAERKGEDGRNMLTAGLGWFALAAAVGSAVLYGLQKEWITAAGSLLILGGIGGMLLFLGRSSEQSGSANTAGSRSARPYSASSSPLEEMRSGLSAQLEESRKRARTRLQGIAFHPEAAASSETDKASTIAGANDRQWSDIDDGSLPDRLEQWAAELADGLRESDRLEERYKEAARAVAVLKEQAVQVRQALGRHEADTAAIQDEWEEWLGQWGISLELPPSFAPDLLVRLEQAKALLESRNRLTGQIRAVREERRSFEEAVGKLLDTGPETEPGLPRHSGDTSGDPAVLLQRMKEELAAASEQYSRMKEAEAALVPLQQELTEVREGILRAEAKLEALWHEAGAGGAEEFRRFGAERENGQRLADELRTLDELLAAGVGTGRLAELDELLAGQGRDELADELAMTERELSELGERVDQWKEQKGRLAAECAKLAEGSEHGERRERREELLSRFRDEASRWAVYAFAAGLLRKARETYEKERQPGVLRQASEHFRRMTDGRYERIVAPVGEQRLVALRRDGVPVESSRLSRGTAEQLYLSIRFALADEFARKTPLPLVMDDIFVNFDRSRLDACVRELDLISERHQILVFTCHAHVLEAMESNLPMVQVIRV